MITIDQYFGDYLHHKDVTDEVMENAERLLDHVLQLYALATYDNVPFPINPETNSQVSGQHLGGFRPCDCSIGSRTSAHKQGLAVDIYDPGSHIDTWISQTDSADKASNPVLESCGLYREHPSCTDGWCHLSTRRPGSGSRTFFP